MKGVKRPRNPWSMQRQLVGIFMLHENGCYYNTIDFRFYFSAQVNFLNFSSKLYYQSIDFAKNVKFLNLLLVYLQLVYHVMLFIICR